MEKFSNKEQVDQELKFSVEQAIQAALFEEEYKEKTEQFNVLSIKRKAEGLTESETREYRTLKIELISGRVDVKTLYEYRKVLEFADFSPEQVNNILNHENAHANVAEQVPSQNFKGYRILFTKDKNGELLVQPFAKLSTDYSFSNEQISEDRVKVAEAPIYYGDRLSPDDKDKIQRLKKDLLTSTTSSPRGLDSSAISPEEKPIPEKAANSNHGFLSWLKNLLNRR